MDNIISRIVPIEKVPHQLLSIFVEKYKLQKLAAQQIIDDHIFPYLNHLKSDLFAVVEEPYVDKVYRDSYYIFYASKLTNHFRDAVRISFFEAKITEEDFRNEEVYHTKLKKLYLGFIVIRPTFPKIIGRTAISPRVLKEYNFISCLTKLDATVFSNKFDVPAFPHASQDTHTITCAETTIWALLEYFAYQYAEYKPVLPSVINRLIQARSFKRTFPSEGLSSEQVTYAIRELGFGSMVYTRRKQKGFFKSLVSIYIESGIPVIGVLKNENGSIGHAVNIIGREIDDPKKVIDTPHHEVTKTGGQLIDYSKIDRKYVFMDDNFPPYQLGELDNPCADYFIDEEEKKKWEDVDLTGIIVPLYKKIYLDAAKAKRNFIQALNSTTLADKLGLSINDKRVLKVFLSSSRSYKQYISLSSGLSLDAIDIISATPMPKFIWVAELSTPEQFLSRKCDTVLIQDATEPGEFSEKGQPIMHALILGIFERVIFRQEFGKFTRYNDTFAGDFNAYQTNLKTA